MSQASETRLTVSTEHLAGEMLLLDLGHVAIVSDHPEALGGSGKGPTPGELVKGALAASAALEIGRLADRGELQGASFGVACSSETETRRLANEHLPGSTILAGFEVHVALSGEADEDLRRGIAESAAQCPVARLIRSGIRIRETNRFEHRPARRPAHGSAHLIRTMKESLPEPGEVAVRPPNRATATSAGYLGSGRALLKFGGCTCIVEDRARESRDRPVIRPEALLLGGLSACTSVFAARAAAMTSAVAEIRITCETVMEDGSPDIASIDKSLSVTGELDEQQKAIIATFADNCAIGETLRRPSEITVRVDFVPAGESLAITDGTLAARRIEEHLDAAACDDASCCVPES